MEIIPIGTKAVTTLDNIQGIITAVFIRHGSVRYEFSYFLNGDYKSIDIMELEFSVEPSQKQK